MDRKRYNFQLFTHNILKTFRIGVIFAHFN